MTLRRASLILPCSRLDDFPTHLTGDRATELLSGWTALWHPALLDALGDVPTLRMSDDLPDVSEFDGELLVLPEISRLRLSENWTERMRATVPKNPPLVEPTKSRSETIAAVLRSIQPPPEGGGSNPHDTIADQVRPDLVGDFLALGHAHLQVELLTRAMRYSTVLDTEHFSNATIAAARRAITGNEHDMREELARAFDLLADARNHVYSVDFYVLDITLLAATTLGEPLRAKLASGFPTSVLVHGELLERMATEHPETLAELRRAIDADTACLVGGTYHENVSAFASPETWLDEITLANAAARRHLNCDYQVFGLFRNSFSPLLPELLLGSGFTGALHATFDGSRLPRAEQAKTWWGPDTGRSIPTVATMPRDASRPETWLKLASKISDTISTDHVATIMLASWPSTSIEFYEDFQRAARYGPVLGKAVTLDEYFRITREPDEWTRFHTREYPLCSGNELGPNPISSHVDAYRRDIVHINGRLTDGLTTIVGAKTEQNHDRTADPNVVINPWNFPCTQLLTVNPITPLGATTGSPDSASPSTARSNAIRNEPAPSYCIPDIPGWGYATLAAAAPKASIPLAEDRTLRNERLEVTISETTGGIQAVRTYHDRNTRLSQRLVYHRGRIASVHDSQMLADEIRITRNDPLIGEIQSRGRLLDSTDEPLATFTQRVRIARGVPAVIVDVEMEPQRFPEGDIWRAYFASRLAWTDDAIAVRRGGQWMSHETGRERIESPGWVQVTDLAGTITIFGFGLPYHRRASTNWLDTLLIGAGEGARRFQFAIAVDEAYPSRSSLGLLTCGQTPLVSLPTPPNISRGWFLHLGAKNIVATSLEPLGGDRQGIRVRLLETEDRATHTTLTAFRPFIAAHITDFRGNPLAVLSLNDGRAEFDISANGFIQIEAEW